MSGLNWETERFAGRFAGLLTRFILDATFSSLASGLLTRNENSHMNAQLIPSFAGELAGTQVDLIDARLLHSFLEVATEFKNWIVRRIADYSFAEGQDFRSFLTRSETGRMLKEYHITLDMAKELSMLERNEKGRIARRYFIECEKMLRIGTINTKQNLTSLEAPASFYEALASKYDMVQRPDGGPRTTITEILKTCEIAPTVANIERMRVLLQREGFNRGVYAGKHGYRLAPMERKMLCQTTPVTDFSNNSISFDTDGKYILDVQRYGITVTKVPFDTQIMFGVLA